MPLVDVLKIVAVIVAVIIYFIPKKKDYEYTALDKKGVLFNIILSVIYIPLSVAGVCMAFFADNPICLTQTQINLLYASIYFGVSIPIMAIGSIFVSAIARKRGKSKFSFCIQFTPIVIFVIAVILLICAII
jgi:hypothetical protein